MAGTFAKSRTYAITNFKTSGEYLSKGVGKRMLGKIKEDNGVSIFLTEAPKVELVEERIEKQETSVIVNSVSQNLDLNVGQPKVAMSILQEGGKSFQESLHKQRKEGLNFGEVLDSPAMGNLQCKSVFNCCLDGFKNESKTKQDLYDIVKRCLELTAKKPGHKTIAFPALGTGVHKYPPDLAAKTMFQAIIEFCSGNLDSDIESIRIVILQKADPSVKKAFHDEFQRLEQSDRAVVELGDGKIAHSYLTIIAETQDSIAKTKADIANRLESPARDKRHAFNQPEGL